MGTFCFVLTTNNSFPTWCRKQHWQAKHAHLNPQRILSTRRGRVGIKACDDGKDIEEKSDGDQDDSKKTDWDASWRSFTTAAGKNPNQPNVFGLPDKDETKPAGADERIERLTNVWSNDKAFLVGIGFVFLIALFYIYVFLSGGIGDSVDSTTLH